MPDADNSYERCTIKSFKHDGSLHRVWVDNWRVPPGRLHPNHRNESAWIFLNDRTTIIEADGKEWISKIPAVAYFMPELWFNVVALLENRGVRYYCNLASPPYRYSNILTYIDYDLDVVLLPGGGVQELDRDEFVRHKAEYRYNEEVENHIDTALKLLRARMAAREFPFGDAEAYGYYEQWKRSGQNEGRARK